MFPSKDELVSRLSSVCSVIVEAGMLILRNFHRYETYHKGVAHLQPLNSSSSSHNRALPIGTRVFYWGNNGQVRYGNVQGTEILPDVRGILLRLRP